MFGIFAGLKTLKIMKINFEYSGFKMILNYDSEGVLQYVINESTGKKMMRETNQVGDGIERKEHNGYVKMPICSATYERIIDADVFVPKFIFIPNTKDYINWNNADKES